MGMDAHWVLSGFGFGGLEGPPYGDSSAASATDDRKVNLANEVPSLMPVPDLSRVAPTRFSF